MYCPNCGEQNAPESKYCAKCGKPLAETGTDVSVTERKRTSGMAIASLVLGILGFFFNILGILAIIFGSIGLGQTGRDPSLGGRGLAIAGLILGIVVIVFWVIIIIFVGSFWAFFV